MQRRESGKWKEYTNGLYEEEDLSDGVIEEESGVDAEERSSFNIGH